MRAVEKAESGNAEAQRNTEERRDFKSARRRDGRMRSGEDRKMANCKWQIAKRISGGGPPQSKMLARLVVLLGTGAMAAI